MKIHELESLPSWRDMKYLALTYSLEGCEVFKELPEEVMDREWNGLGPDRLPKRIRDFLDKLYKEVLPAACIHDFRFVIGGTRQQFYAANAELKRNMNVCLRRNRRNFSMVGYWMAKIRVSIAKFLCDQFGWEGWNKAQEVHC